MTVHYSRGDAEYMRDRREREEAVKLVMCSDGLYRTEAEAAKFEFYKDIPNWIAATGDSRTRD